MADPYDMEGRASLLPLRRLPTGEREWALPGVLAGMLNAASLPGRAMAGEAIKPESAVEAAMSMTGGGLLSPKSAGLALGMGGGTTRRGAQVLDFGLESATVKTNRLAHRINERATTVDKLKGQIDTLNRERVGGLQDLAQNLEKLKVRLGSIGTDGLRNIKPAELALKLKDQHSMSAQEARTMASQILKDYESYVADFQKSTKLSEEYNALVNQYATESSGVMEMKGEYNKMLHDLYQRTIGDSTQTPRGRNPQDSVKPKFEELRSSLLDDTPRSASEAMAAGDEYQIPVARVMRELQKHGQTWADFVKDKGDKITYSGKEVLEWLGY